MAGSRAIIDRLRTALLELLPRSCTVTDAPTTIFCSDEVAVAAQILVSTERAARIAVIAGPASDMIVGVWFGYDLADEVWAVDTSAGQVEQFGKRSGERRLLRASDQLRSFVVPQLVVALETILAPLPGPQ
jgi:hypothetical protein